MSAMIHIAGFAVRIGSRGRQLCAWCGAKLFDVDHANEVVPLNRDGSPGIGSRPWETGELIAVDGGLSYVLPHTDGDALPPGTCVFPTPTLRVVK